MEYHTSQKILLVGEGDFSFALCLAREFGSADNMVATSLETRESLEAMYANASSNLTELEYFNCTILHEVNVHTMTEHPDLINRLFDQIIFNFPHAGFICRWEHNAYQIELHQGLVSGFLRNAKDMIYNFDGEIHITHKTAHPFSKWDLKKLGENEGLFLKGEEEFDQETYPGYNNKRGSGRKCDQSFPIGKSSTFKFAF